MAVGLLDGETLEPSHGLKRGWAGIALRGDACAVSQAVNGWLWDCSPVKTLVPSLRSGMMLGCGLLPVRTLVPLLRPQTDGCGVALREDAGAR